jgi:exodeoxyribonuclease V alpha subunit
MDFIKGKYTKSIFKSDSGYLVGLFRVKESSENLKDINNRTVTITGTVVNMNDEDTYVLYGEYINNERYGYQFRIDEYKKIEPEGIDAVYEFLSSSFVKGCGKATAKKIVDAYHESSIDKIKEDINNLINIGISNNTALKIYNSIKSYYDKDEVIIYLKELGFSINDINLMLKKHPDTIKNIIENDIYDLVDIIDFNKLDKVYFKLFDETKDIRINACILESLKQLAFINGDIYSYKEEIVTYLFENYEIDLGEYIDDYLNELNNLSKIIIKDNKYYLYSNYMDEYYIAKSLKAISNYEYPQLLKFKENIESLGRQYGIEYDEEQINAIRSALENPITIITGGPGTGKTTIINGILRLFRETYKLYHEDMTQKVTLLAPTGRAAKRMSETTLFPASTIHRYLKWNIDTNEFQVNEYNPIDQELLIIDEVSMIDNNLFASLLRGIRHNVRLVLVGDSNQLPSVGPGNILYDLIKSDMFNHISLNNIYRQSDNSFIPILAREIKDKDIDENLQDKHDDYNFLICSKDEIKGMIVNIVKKYIERGYTEKDVQVLIPQYKSQNGIDNVNVLLQQLFNPSNDSKDEVTIGSITYRVNDKVINLVNNTDNDIFNGDIGYIKAINKFNSKEFMTIDYYGKYVTIKREDITTIKHAYAMSIHKSQGSEFNHVILPMSMEYVRMLYNKLLYTGVSRAKKTLVMCGDPKAFMMAVNNNYSKLRKTTLKDSIIYLFTN